MEKMFILIAFLFSAFVPEYARIAVPQRQEVVLSTTSCSITSLSMDNVSGCQDNGTADPFDDFFTADILVEFVDPPTTGQLRVELGEDAMPGGGPLSIDVSDIADPGSHIFEGIRIEANGNPTEVPVSFSAEPSCRETISNGPAVSNCSGSLPCEITSVTFDLISVCNNNGTADPSDDFFTARVSVSFFNPPATGDLRIEPGGDALPGGGATSIPVASLSNEFGHSFVGVRFKADGTVTSAEVAFTANTNCVQTGVGPTVPSCSTPPPPCIIIVNFLGNPSPCDNNGTPNDPSDDFFTQNIHASFFNHPLTGNLQIVPGGDAIGVYSIAVNQIVGNAHTFNGVKLKADGTPTVIQMNFTDNPACIDEETGPTVEGNCCDLVVVNVVATPESCPNTDDGSITVTATTSAGPLTYAITGPVNQSNNSGVFTGLPNGAYVLTVTDNGAPGCSETASAFVPAGVDLVPPTPVCRNTTVTLDATGNYTLTVDDVLDLGASSDNCGAVNLIGKFPETVSCVQVGQTIPVNVMVNDGNGNTAACTAQITVQEGTALPAGFSGDNVGNANGTNAFQPCFSQKFTVTASGFSTASSDVLRLVSRQLCGNGEMIAHVTNISGGGWAGITLRETTGAGSKKVALKTQFTNNIRREIRTTANGAVNNLNFFRPQDAWLRLVRSGSNFSGYTSADGVNWNFAFSATISMAGCIRVGLFSESINTNATTTAVFDQVTVTGAVAPLIAPGTGTVASFEMPDFQVYPNPTTGELMLDLSTFSNREVRIEISNVHGQTLNMLKLNPADGNTEHLDLSHFQAGIYLIAAKSEGWPAVVKRVVLMEHR